MSTPQGNITPTAKAAEPIDPGVRIGHVHLRTSDIDRVRAFYVDILGFDVVSEARGVPGWGTTGDILFISAGGYHHHLGFNTWKSGGGPQPDGVAGLHHVALAYPTRAALADAYRRLKRAGWPIRQTADHGTHEAIYVSDPDGNDVELTWDRPDAAWPLDEGGHLVAQFGDELDLDELLTGFLLAVSVGLGPAGVDGRFAPSPSGPLHLGSLRTALVAWLFARSQSARFLLRIEDLDPQRSRREYERSAVRDLSALGIDWDEPPVRQSERFGYYEDALAKLAALGRLYPCFCTRAEIREAACAPHGPLPEGAYPGTCRNLSTAQRRAREAEGSPFALRVRADCEEVMFEDRLLGLRSAVVDDFVVRRADAVPAYQLAVVVDDAAQQIGEVVRGADLADSTPRQILIARLLGLPVPRYAHVPLVLAPDGARLAKRHGSVTLADRREPPAATLALLAHSLDLASGRKRIDTAAALLPDFDPDRLPAEPVFAGGLAGFTAIR